LAAGLLKPVLARRDPEQVEDLGARADQIACYYQARRVRIPRSPLLSKRFTGVDRGARRASSTVLLLDNLRPAVQKTGPS